MKEITSTEYGMLLKLRAQCKPHETVDVRGGMLTIRRKTALDIIIDKAEHFLRQRGRGNARKTIT